MLGSVVLAAALAMTPASSGVDGAVSGVATRSAGTLEAVVAGGDTPVLVLTNRGDKPCAIVGTATGTVAVSRVAQAGAAVVPVPVQVAFDDGPRLEERVRVLEPGARAELPLTVLAEAGDLGRVLEVVSWSPDDDAYGTLYPIKAGQAVDMELMYSIPIDVEQPCPPARAVTGQVGGAPAAVKAGDHRLLFVVGGVAILLVFGLLIVLLVTRRRKRGAAALMLLAFIPAGLLTAEPADAYYVPDSGLQAAFDDCMAMFRQPGNDPAGILDNLDGDHYRVQITRPAPGTRVGANVLRDPPLSIIYWDPEDRRPYHGTGGNADPCTTLYHELHHAWQGEQGIYSDTARCATPDGASLPLTEVLATRAQNLLRQRLGMPPRSHYGRTPLPSGDCEPPGSGDRCSDPHCGDSNGDPHLLTFDHRRYDFQAAGEFVLSRGPGFEVQVRQEPVPGSRVVAVNTATAMAVGGSKVEVRATSAGLALVVDGAAKALTPARLPGGAIKASRDAVVVSWQDGARVYVRPIGRIGLHVAVRPAPAQAGTLEGLLGDFDGDSRNDVRPRSKEPIEPSFAALYPGFADSWRIDAATSLFTYEPGTSPESYVDKTFPEREASADGLPGRTAAEALCRARGVTVEAVFEACVLDVALTGMPGFASAAAAGQVLGGGDGFTGTQWQLSIDSPGGVAKAEFQGEPGQRVFIDVPVTSLPDQCGSVTLHAPGGRQLGTGCLRAGRGHIDGVTLPVAGTYTITIDPPGDRTGRAAVRLVPVTDHQAAITPDGPEVKALVAHPGAVSRLVFPGKPGQKVFVKVTGVTLPDRCGGFDLISPTGRQVATGCATHGRGHIDAVELLETGEYTILVDPAERATGEATVRLIAAVDARAEVTVGGPAATVELRQPGAAGHVTFSGTAGQRVTVEVSGSTLPDRCGGLSLRGPGGRDVGVVGCLTGGAVTHTVTLPATGTYTLVIDPGGEPTGLATVRVR